METKNTLGNQVPRVFFDDFISIIYDYFAVFKFSLK
jgi:hypothetical protein